MRIKTIVSIFVAVSLVAFGMPRTSIFARDGGEDNPSVSPAPSETSDMHSPEPTDTPEHRDTTEPSVSASPEHTPEMSESGKNAAELAKHASEKIAEAQLEVDKLNAAIKSFSGTLPQSVQQAADLSNQKLNDAKAALASGNSSAAGQAEAAKSIAEHGLEMLNNEYEADSIEKNLNQEIDSEDISRIDINPASGSMGLLRVHHKDNTSTEQTVPPSETSLFQVNTADGTIGAHIASGSKVVLDNGDLNIESDLPVSVDVQDKKVFVQVASGSEELKTLPAQALSQLSNKEKPDKIKQVTLTDQNGTVVFEVTGTRETKFFGLVPLTVNTTTTLDSQNGAVVSVTNPWFIKAFGFLFQ